MPVDMQARRFRLGDKATKQLARLKLRASMTREQWKAFQDNADAQAFVDAAIDDFLAEAEPKDWASFFAALAEFLAALMEILGPLLVT